MEGKNIRRGGILLHVTSLPGPEGIGTLGKGAYEWIDFLEKAGMTLWQVLPVGPTGYGESPYQSACALAGDSDMIDLALLHEEGWLKDYQPEEVPAGDQVDFEAVRAVKERWLRQAFKENRQRLQRQKAFDSWCKRWPWLHDYALFMAIKQHFNRISWMEWPDEDIRLRRPEAMDRYKAELAEDIRFFVYMQYLFFVQWGKLRAYAEAK